MFIFLPKEPPETFSQILSHCLIKKSQLLVGSSTWYVFITEKLCKGLRPIVFLVFGEY